MKYIEGLQPKYYVRMYNYYISSTTSPGLIGGLDLNSMQTYKLKSMEGTIPSIGVEH